MGSEYTLGKHETNVETPTGFGISLMAYEMSGTFDVYADLPKDRVDVDAWENAARVDLWKDLDPESLFLIGYNIMRTASYHILDADKLKTEVMRWCQE
jgi:hypothetical protein